MKFLKIIIILYVMVLCSCSIQEDNANECSIDYEFKAYYQNCINIIAVREAGVQMDQNAYAAYYCLQSLTNHRGFMDLNSDTPLAYNYSDTVDFFCKDLEVWNDWYRHNKCEMDITKAQAILEKDSVSWPKFLDEFDLKCSIVVLDEDSILTEGEESGTK